jgi:hypothetical protein
MKTKNAQAEIRALVDTFVEELTQHIRTAAVESVQAALLYGGAPARTVAPSSGPKHNGQRGATKAAPKPARSGKTAKGRRRARRSPEQIEAAKALIVSHVRSNPGTAMGEMSATLGEDPTVIRAQLNELLKSGALRKEGERRGTRYFAGTGRPATRAGKKTGRGKTGKRMKAK